MKSKIETNFKNFFSSSLCFLEEIVVFGQAVYSLLLQHRFFITSVIYIQFEGMGSYHSVIEKIDK